MDTGYNLSNIVDCNSSNPSCHDPVDGVEEKATELYIVVAILTLFSIVGTIGNATSFYIYFKRRDKSTSVIFILALAGTDFLTCLVIIPYTIIFELVNYYLYYDILCKLYMFLITSNIPFSAFIMTAIAFDRYLCICHPFLHALNVTRAKILVLCLAFLALTFGMITGLSYGTYSNYFGPEEMEGMVSPDLFYNTTEYDVMDYPDAVANNETNETTTNRGIYFHGDCALNKLIISDEFLNAYQKVYTGCFLVSFVAVVILYCMIYHSILARRAKKAKRKRKKYYTSVAGTEREANTMNTLTTTVNGNSGVPVTDKVTSQKPGKRPSTVRDTTLYANIKTALMLFVVTIVFTIAFLPSWLMAHQLLPFNMIVFYMYFSYNLANPIIYAFMNQTFREDLKNIVKICK
ncbi:neuropeptide Y receptor type 4 [Patella vulgata]|uniref:neuropeptide Y receptor type 4 n=1 Tax=Patella vulgata TaxID=6465 RepID=UPI00217F27DF|nr:neuropeptide Y receptor type 4 [Patella vulgata]XP_050412323.1 neuropeptide Y receptor type 4 [Patella vulgata]